MSFDTVATEYIFLPPIFFFFKLGQRVTRYGNYNKSCWWVAWDLTLPLELVPFPDSVVSTAI